MEEKPLNQFKFSFKQIKNKFDLISSENGTNWLLALNWILIIEFISSIIEYNFLDIAKNYVEPLQNGLYKELLIASLIVLFIWYSIYNFIFMKKQEFFTFTLFASLCTYLLFTRDLTFNLLLHNLNIFEITLDGFGFYMIIQLFLKLVIFYLIFKMLAAFKNRNKSS